MTTELAEVKQSPNAPPRAAAGNRFCTILVLYLWSILVVLYCLGGFTGANPETIGYFVAVSGFILSCAAAVISNIRSSAVAYLVASIISFLAVAVLPPVIGVPSAGEIGILWSLYFILLLAIPAILDIWPWKLQLFAGIIALSSNLATLAGDSVSEIAQSLLLVTVAVALSTFSRYSRTVSGLKLISFAERELTLFREFAAKKLPMNAGQIMLIQSAFLVILIFIDLSLSKNDLLTPALCKIYGLIIIVFGSLLASVNKSHQLSRTLAMTTALLGVILSLSRLGYGVDGSIYYAMPVFCLMFITVSVAWEIERQMLLVWLLLFEDLLIKTMANQLAGDGVFRTLGIVIHNYQSEIGLLVLGSLGSVLASWVLHRYRMKGITQFLDVQDRRQVGVDEQGLVSQELKKVQFPLSLEIYQKIYFERNRRLILGLLGMCVISNVVAGSIFYLTSEQFRFSVLAYLVVSFTSWGFLLLHERKNPGSAYLWPFGALFALLILLCGTLFLLHSYQLLAFWVFWLGAFLCGVGCIPWGIKELVILVVVSLCFQIELSSRYGISIVENSSFIALGLLGIWLSIIQNRRIVSKVVLGGFCQELNVCTNTEEVLRVLAQYASQVFKAKKALISKSSEHLELVRGSSSYLLSGSDWPLQALRKQITNIEFSADGVGFTALRWLSPKFDFYDDRFGFFSANFGLLIDLGKYAENSFVESKISDSQVKVQPERILVFVVTQTPLFTNLCGYELALCKVLLGEAKLRIKTFFEEQIRIEAVKQAEGQLMQREYELSALVHDINNTVQDLTLLCDMILDDLSSPNSKEGEAAPQGPSPIVTQVNRIAVIARSVATVVSDAKRRRELEKLEDMTLRELVEVREVIQELVSFAAVRAERKRIQIEPPILPDEEAWVLISVREHLETVLRNLLNNAVMYSDPGTAIRIQLRVDTNWVWIDVVDHGIGLTEEECKTVFLPGVRGREASEIHGGLGLGLAESRRVTESAGGRLEASSAGRGLGSTFTVVLPRQQPKKSAQLLHPWALLVDDQPILTDLYSRIARAMEITPEIACSVTEATNLLRLHGKPTIVVTDIHLGSSDGLDLVKHLRVEFGNQLPILVISGLGSEDIAQRARAAGASDFIAKPVGQRALFARIQSLLA